MLFLSRGEDKPAEADAPSEVERYGFRNVDVMEGRKIVVEALNDPKMQVFQRYYESAFNQGSALVWYP